MILAPDGSGRHRASGGKYYIGNGNEAAMVSVFGRVDGIEGPDGYAFFATDSQHPDFELIRNVVNSQNYVSQFELREYPVTAEDMLHTGPGAFDAALNTVNIGKSTSVSPRSGSASTRCTRPSPTPTRASSTACG